MPLTFALFIIFIVFLCWGSFLNVVAYRTAFDENFLTRRSYCPSCRSMIAWYDNIPVLSWLILQGQCRTCKTLISAMYPFIELSTACVVTLFSYQLLSPFAFSPDLLVPATFIAHNTLLFYQWLTMTLFFSLLLINTATDLYTLTVAQLFTLWPIPCVWLCALLGILPLSLQQSFFGAVIGYVILWTVATLFKKLQGQQGMGEGDFELLALIGSVVGITGVWYTLLIASASGSIIGLAYLALTKQHKTTPIPFGPFLALGAIIYLCLPSLPFFLLNLLS